MPVCGQCGRTWGQRWNGQVATCLDCLDGTQKVPEPEIRVVSQEKILDRLKKVLAHAARRDTNEKEAEAFARRAFLMLSENDLPLRYIVGIGAEVRILPTQFLKHPHRKTLLKKTLSRRRNMFTEANRLKDQDGRDAIERGFLAFDRFGYTVFVRLKDVQVFF